MSARSTRWLLTGAVVLAACGGPTEPGGSGGTAAVRVSLVATSAPYINYTADGLAYIACAIDLKAVAHGSTPATWKEAVFRWYPGDDLSAPFDTATVAVDLVQQSWGGQGGIGSAAPQFSRWGFYSSVPFTAELAFRYQVGAGPVEITEPVRTLCSPPVPDTPGPVSVSSVTLATPVPEVEAGGVLQVAYTASAPAGLWQVVAEVSGACGDTLLFAPGGLVPQVSGTIPYTIPHGCSLNQPVSVVVHAVDVALQTASRDLASTPLVVDRTPPQLWANAPLGAQYFVGDTINAWLGASENDGLAWFVWEVQPGGVRDSVAPTLHGPFAPIVIGAHWAGQPAITFWARDRGGLESAPVQIPAGQVTVYPTTVVPRRVGAFQAGATQALFSADGASLYLLDFNLGTVWEMSLQSMVQTRTLVQGPAKGMERLPGGDSLLVVLPDVGVGVVPVAQGGIADSILFAMPAGLPNALAYGARALSDGHVFLDPANTLLDLDRPSTSVTTRLDVAPADGVGLMARSADHRVVLISTAAGLRRYEVGTGGFVASPPGIPGTGRVSLSADGSVAAWGTRLFDATLQPLGIIEGSWGSGVETALSPDGQWLYIMSGAYVIRARTSDGKIVDRLPTPLGWRLFPMLHVSDDGRLLVITDSFNSSSTVQLLELP